MQLDNLLKKGVSLFPGDLKLSEFNDKFRQLFREGKSSTQPDDDDSGDDGDQNDGDDPNDDDGRDDGKDNAKDDDASASQKPDPKDKDGDGDKDGSAPGGDDGKDDDGSAPGGGDDGDADKDNVSAPVGDKDGDADKDASAPVSDNAAQLDESRETVENNPKDNDNDIDGDHVTLGDPGNNFEDSAFDDWFSDLAFVGAFEKVNQMAKPHSFSTLEDLTAPSFSLLSQDYSSPPSCAPILPFHTVSPRPVVVPVAECSPSVVPQDAADHEGKIDLKQPKLKRLIKPSKYYSSPYKGKQTDVLTAATDLEFAVSGSIFCMQDNPMEVVFQTSSGYMSYRVVMTSSMWDGNLSFDKSYEIFASNMLVNMEEDLDMLSMRDVNLVFFPIVAREHYYLIVFNLKWVAFNIIDNSAACSDYNVKYKETTSVVHDLFAKHLETYGHPKASSIAKAKPHVLKIKWRTVNNHVDCGVFLMCHMDTYNAESVSNWNPGLLTETATGKVTQKLQLTKLRMKYATKILLHDINIQKDKMVAYADEFAKHEFVVGREMINEAIKDREARASRV